MPVAAGTWSPMYQLSQQLGSLWRTWLSLLGRKWWRIGLPKIPKFLHKCIYGNPLHVKLTHVWNYPLREGLYEYHPGDWVHKFFDEATQDVEADGPQLLQVDGHGPHTTLSFLLYAKEHNIIVHGYPPHCIHLLQGLDVIIFSPLKHAYALRATEFYETTHNEVDKAESLTILGKAVDDTLTEDNILLAWKKTGLHPVDPSVITPEMLAPSKVFAQDETFPVPSSSPIHSVIAAFKEMHINSQDFSNITPSSQPVGPMLLISSPLIIVQSLMH